MECVAVWIVIAVIYGSIHFFRWVGRVIRARRAMPPRPRPIWQLFWRCVLWGHVYIFTSVGVLKFLEAWGVSVKSDNEMLALLILVALAFISGFALRKLWARRLILKAEHERLAANVRDQRQRDNDQRTRLSAQRRRDDVRVRLEAVFHTHGPEIEDRFPRSSFDEFCRRHLTDQQSPEVVEMRGEQLLAIIQSHLVKREPVQTKPSLEGILATFDDRRRKVESAGLEPADEDYLLTQLNELRDEAIRKAVLDGTL